jgi:hypothetical protein
MRSTGKLALLATGMTALLWVFLLAGASANSDLGLCRALYRAGDLQDRSKAGLMVNCLGHENPHVRRIAATALGKISHAGSRAALVRLAEDPGQPVMVRLAALRSLHRQGALDAPPRLRKSRRPAGPSQEAAISRSLTGLEAGGRL